MGRCLHKLNNNIVRRLEYNLLYPLVQERNKSARKMPLSTSYNLLNEFAILVTAVTTPRVKTQLTLKYAYTAKYT